MAAPLLTCLVLTFGLAAAQEAGYSLQGQEILIQPPDFARPDKIFWRHNGKEVVTFDGREQLEFGSFRDRVQLDWFSAALRVHDGRFQDSGEYQLEVWFKNPENQIQTMSYSWEVIDQVSISGVSCEMTGDLQAQLLCSAESSHPELLTFEWSFNGSQHLGSNLTVELQDQDQRRFTCRVKNPLSEDSASLEASGCFPETSVVATVVPILVVLLLIAVLLILGFVFRKKLKALCASTSPADVEKQSSKPRRERGGPLRRVLNIFKSPAGPQNESNQEVEESKSLSRELTLPSHQPLAPLLSNVERQNDIGTEDGSGESQTETSTPEDLEGTREVRVQEMEPRSAESDEEREGEQEMRPAQTEAGSHDPSEEDQTELETKAGNTEDPEPSDPLIQDLPDEPRTPPETPAPDPEPETRTPRTSPALED